MHISEFNHILGILTLAKRKLHIVVLLLLTFVGQSLSFAYVSELCPMMNAADKSVDEMHGGMDHSQHDLDKHNSEANIGSIDCCNQGDCPMSGCTSVLPGHDLISFQHKASSNGVNLYIAKLVETPASNLYRPPIFRSYRVSAPNI